MAIDADYVFICVKLEDYLPILNGARRQLRNAFDFLTFSAATLTLADLRPSATRHQIRRITTHPFIVHDGALFLVRDLQFEALQRWIRYFQNGDWPTPVSKRIGESLKVAIKARRDARGRDSFEPFVQAQLERASMPWTSTSGANKAIGRTTLTGEVDALVADAERGIIWVIEAKDVTSDQNVRSMQSELTKIRDKYWPQVTRTATDVRHDPMGVALHVVQSWSGRNTESEKAVVAVRDWTVRPLLVVRDRSAGEFAVGQSWEITPVAGLEQMLRSG